MPEVLRSIYLGRRTGMLRFIRNDERLSVRFMSGHIVYGEASVQALRLGEVLVASGKLEAAVFERALAVVLRDRKRMGAVLMEMGVLDENGIEEALALQVRAILLRVFSMREGTYTFQEQDPEAFLDDDWPLAISTAEAVLGAVRAVPRPDDVVFALGNVDRVLVGSDDPLVLYQRMDLGAEEGAVIARVNGILPAREVLLRTGLPLPVAERSLFALLCTGILEYAAGPATPADAPAPAELRQEILGLYDGLGRRSDHELLGVAPGASAADLKAAYFRLAGAITRRLPRAGLADLRAKVEAVSSRQRPGRWRPRPPRASQPAAEAPARPADAFGFEEMRPGPPARRGQGSAAALAGRQRARRRMHPRPRPARPRPPVPDRRGRGRSAGGARPIRAWRHYLLGTCTGAVASRHPGRIHSAAPRERSHSTPPAEMDALERAASGRRGRARGGPDIHRAVTGPRVPDGVWCPSKSDRWIRRMA